MKTYDLIIIGAGAAGLAAALKLSKSKLKVLILEKGREPYKRHKDVINGWFGRAFYSLDVLELYDKLNSNKKHLGEALRLIRRFTNQQGKLQKKNLQSCVLGMESGILMGTRLFELLSNKVDISFLTESTKVELENGSFRIYTNKEEYFSKRCIIATGGNSFQWILNFKEVMVEDNINAKIGVRIEIPTVKIKKMFEDNRGAIALRSENFKSEDIHFNSIAGEWDENELVSACSKNIKSDSFKTNFFVNEEMPLDKAIKLTQIINVLGNDRVKKEKAIEFLEGMSLLNPIKEFAELDNFLIESDKQISYFVKYATIHIPEIKPYGILQVNEDMETNILNLYGAGECTIKAHTILGAFASGITAAQTILKS